MQEIEKLTGLSLPRLYVFSPEALVDIQNLDSSDPDDIRPLFSERRFVRQYWLNGLWHFFALPLVLLAVILRLSSLQLSTPIAIAVVLPLLAALIWWLNFLSKADLSGRVGNLSVSRVDHGVVEPLDLHDCVVVVRRAIRPRAFQRYRMEALWEFTRGADMPLYFAQQFDPKGTAWIGVLGKR